MFFTNLFMYRFPITHSLDDLDDSFAKCALKPVGPMEMVSTGFVPPYGGEIEDMTCRIGNCIWFSVGQEKRLLPGSVVNGELAKKLATIEKNEGRKPGGKTRKRIKDEIVHDLLPKSFVQPHRTNAFIDTAAGVIYVDTSSRKVAETVISQIRLAVGSFPALPLNAEIAPRSILTGWVAGEELPDGISLGDECELQDPVDQGALVRCKRQELESDEISGHLETGKQVTRLALTLDDHVSFVIGEDLVVRKFKLLDGAVDQMDTDIESVRAELDARFALMSAEVARMFTVLQSALKISAIDTDGQKPAGARATAFDLTAENPETLRAAHYEDSAARGQATASGSIPSDVYYSVENDNFYSTKTRAGMGDYFHTHWRSRSAEFPADPGTVPA